jgi:hypothetical protein
MSRYTFGINCRGDNEAFTASSTRPTGRMAKQKGGNGVALLIWEDLKRKGCFQILVSTFLAGVVDFRCIVEAILGVDLQYSWTTYCGG